MKNYAAFSWIQHIHSTKSVQYFRLHEWLLLFFLSSVDVCNAERIAIATQRTKKQRRVWRQDNGNHLHNWHENSAQQNKWKCFLLFVFPAHTLPAKIAKNGFLYLPFSVFIQKTIKSSVVLVVTTTTTATIKCWIVHVTLVFSILMLSAHFKNYSLSSQDICSCHLIIERRMNKLQIYNFLINFPHFIREDKKTLLFMPFFVEKLKIAEMPFMRRIFFLLRRLSQKSTLKFKLSFFSDFNIAFPLRSLFSFSIE